VSKLVATRHANNGGKASAVPPVRETISYEDFMKMDIRTATVVDAVKVPKTKKLLKLTLDTGVDRRTVVSGIAGVFDPAELVGRKVCVLANLAPRRIKGIESNGMILMAEDTESRLYLISPPDDTPDGSEVK